MNTYKLTVTRQ